MHTHIVHTTICNLFSLQIEQVKMNTFYELLEWFGLQKADLM